MQANGALLRAGDLGLGREHEALHRSLMGAAKPSSGLWRASPESGRHVGLFGLALENTSLAGATGDLIGAAKNGRRTRVVFANAHVVNTLHEDAAYRAAVASADRIYADGSGLAIAARLSGRPLADNVNGTDMFPLLCQEAIRAGLKIFLLGGKPGIAKRAAATLEAFGLGAAIAGVYHGYFVHGSREEDEVIARINASGADIVLVGFGVPVQDTWVQENAGRIAAPVIAGVGGLFDFFAGTVQRSPKIMRSAGCEWVWRLMMEPQRMARRYLVGNATFLRHAVAERRRIARFRRASQAVRVRGSAVVPR